jgi:hypothetical protein
VVEVVFLLSVQISRHGENALDEAAAGRNLRVDEDIRR